VISGFHHGINENCTLLSSYAVSSGNFLLTFRNNIRIPSSRMGFVCCTKLSIRNYHYSLPNNPEENSAHNAGFLSVV
jgi:hypothetical protein